MAGTSKTTSTKDSKLKLPEFNHNAEIYAKHNLTDKLLNNLYETTKLYGKRILCNQRKLPISKYN